MTLLLSDTFTDSLARLTSEERKLVKTTVFDLQVNPANPGYSLYKLDDSSRNPLCLARAPQPAGRKSDKTLPRSLEAISMDEDEE